MKVSYNWLKEFVDIELSAAELAEKITMAGLEVDSVTKIDTCGSVVGEIVDIIEKDNLYLTKVDIGSEVLNIATADKNVNLHDKFPVVKEGALLSNGVKISKKKFGDFVSEGMMLSAEELNLEDSSSGLLKLDETLRNGMALSEIDEFNDYIIDIELTPNRADALSILGVARDIKAITKKSIKYPKMDFALVEKNIKNYISVKIDDYKNCPRYTLLMADVVVKPSPMFIRLRLLKSGIRPINNVVDITNYVLMAMGQPMHSFDFNRLSGDICVRRAKNKEKILALDSKEYELDESMLVIADSKKPVAIAGVMGSEESSVTDDTKTVALESAHFNPVSVRMTARKLKLHSESSHRFERGVDPNLCLTASSYAMSLLEKYADAKVYMGYIDQKETEFKPKTIVCSFEGINRLLGSDFEQKAVKEIVEYLDFKPKVISIDKFKVTIPTYRFDIEGEADIAEEVARCMGYDKIAPTLPVVQTSFKRKKPVDYAKHQITKTLADMGLSESVNYSFTDSSKLKLFSKNEDEFVYLKNPLIEGQDVMRTTLVCGLLDNLKFNMSKNAKSAALFEIGRVFFKDGDFAKESDRLGAVMWGEASFNWIEGRRFYDFYDMKSVTEMLEKLFNIEFLYRKTERKFLHTGRGADLFVGGKDVGFIGELHPDFYDYYDIKFDKNMRIILCEVDLNSIAEYVTRVKMFEKLPKLPTVVRDLAVVVDKSINASDVKRAIGLFDNVYEVVLFDVYDKLEDSSKKSLAFRIVLKNDDKTFVDTEIEEIMNNIFNALVKKFDAKLRG